MAETEDDRPKPYPIDDEGNRVEETESTGTAAAKDGDGDDGDHGEDDQDLVDRSTIDFDPDDGLLSGTAIDGTSDIPGPHEDEDGEVSKDEAPENENEDGEDGDDGDGEGSKDEASDDDT